MHDPDGPRVSRRSLLAAVASTPAVGLAGCVGNVGSGGVDAFVLAATVRDDPDDVARDYAPLAAWIEVETGVTTRVDPVQSDSAAIAALAAGQAHAAYLSGGPAWVGWQRYGLEPLAVEADAAGNTHYTAAAWVRADSDIASVADLAGVDSCHTGNLKGAGMLMPMAHLAHEGLVSFDGSDDINDIRVAVDAFFGDPLVGGGYVGALQCLSTGHGDVAFVRGSTPEDYCGGPDAPAWCLDLDEYEVLVEFGEVPSHPVMASPAASEAEVTMLRDALLALNDSDEGRQILEDVFGVHALTTATARDHLGPYGELIEILPGIEDHLIE